jgi:hypothetical protein
MSQEQQSKGTLAAVVQDALSGEILWVGHLEETAPQRIAKSGVIVVPRLAGGQPHPVRHLSSRGDGLVIHVESPYSRRQLDSLLPEPQDGYSEREILDFQMALSTRHEGVRVSGPQQCVSPYEPIENASRLEACVGAYRAATSSGNLKAVAEGAAEILWSLLDELESANVPMATTLSAFARRHPD